MNPILLIFIIVVSSILFLFFFEHFWCFTNSRYCDLKDTPYIKILLNKKIKRKYKLALMIEHYESQRVIFKSKERKPNYFIDIQVENFNSSCPMDYFYVNENGMYIISVFNFTDNIYGGEDDASWISRKGKKKRKISNCYRLANDKRILLANLLGLPTHTIASVMVFPDKTNIKNINLPVSNSYVVTDANMLKLFNKIQKENTKYFNHEQIKEIMNTVLQYGYEIN